MRSIIRFVLILGLLPSCFAAITLSVHSKCQSNQTTCTTPAIDTTGVKLITIVETGVVFNDIMVPPTDSKGNVFQALPASYNRFSIWYVAVYYICSPTVGTGHTFTVTDSTNYYGLFISAYSGTIGGGSGTSCLDTYSGNGSTAPGAITPSGSGELILGAESDNVATSVQTVDSSLTISDSYFNTSGSEGASAWLEYGSTSPINPTWSNGVNSNSATVVVAFKQVSGSSNSKTPSHSGAL